MKLNYEERQALEVLRKSLQRNPDMATALLEGMSKQTAINILLQAKVEMTTLLSVIQAVSQAAMELIKLDKSDGVI